MSNMKVISPDPEGKARPIQQGTGDVAFISSCLPKVPVAYNPSWKWQTGCNLTIHCREAGSVGQELCFTVSQKTKWLQRKKSTELGIGTLPQSIPLHRLSGVHPVTLFQDPDAKKPRTYHSCILAFSPVPTSSNLPLVTPSGFLLGLRFDMESDLLMWVAAIKDAVSSPIGSSHLPSVFHVTVPRHQVVEAQDALLMLEPVTPYPTSAVLRHAITLDAIHAIELWKVVSIGHRLDVSQLWLETLPASVKSRDNSMITVLCNDVVKASEALRQAIAPHLLFDETMQENVSNQLVTYRKCRTLPGSQLRSPSPVSTEYATIAIAAADRRESSASTSSSIFSWKSLPNLQKERINCVYGSVADAAVGGSAEYLATSPPMAAAAGGKRNSKPFAAVPPAVQQADATQLCIADRPYDLTAVKPGGKYRSKATQQSTRSLPPAVHAATGGVRSSSLHDLRSVGVRRGGDGDDDEEMVRAVAGVHGLELGRLNARARLLPGQADTHSAPSSADAGGGDAPTSGSLGADAAHEYKNILADKDKAHGSIRVGQKRSVPGLDGYTEIAPDESTAGGAPSTARDRVRKLEERRRQASLLKHATKSESLKHATKSESSLSHASTLPRSLGRLASANEPANEQRAARRQLAVPGGEQESRSDAPAAAASPAKRPSALARHSVASPLSHAVSLDRLPLELERPTAERLSASSRSTSNLSCDRSVSPGSDDAFNAMHFYHDIAPKDGSSSSSSSAVTDRPLPVPGVHGTATRSKSVPSAASIAIHPPPPAEEDSRALQRAKKISSRRKAAAATAAAAAQAAGDQAAAAPLAVPRTGVYSYDVLQAPAAAEKRAADLPSHAPAAAGATYNSTTHALTRRASAAAAMLRRADAPDADYSRLEPQTAPPVAAPRARNIAGANMDSPASQGSVYSVPPPPVRADNYEVVDANEYPARTQPNAAYDVPPQPVRAGNTEVVDSDENPAHTQPSGAYDVPPLPVRANNYEDVDSKEKNSLPQLTAPYDVPRLPVRAGSSKMESVDSDENPAHPQPSGVYDVPPQTYDVPPLPVRSNNYEDVDSNKNNSLPQSTAPYDVPPLPVRADNYEVVDETTAFTGEPAASLKLPVSEDVDAINETTRSAGGQSADAVTPRRPPKPSYMHGTARPVQSDGRGAQAQQEPSAAPVPARQLDGSPPTGQEPASAPAEEGARPSSAGEPENEYMSMENSDISHLKQSIPAARSTAEISARSDCPPGDLYVAMAGPLDSVDHTAACAPATSGDGDTSSTADASASPPLDGRPAVAATSGDPPTAMPRCVAERQMQAPASVQPQRYSQDDQYVDIRQPNSQDDPYVNIQVPSAAAAVDKSNAGERFPVPVSRSLSARNVYSTVDDFERTPGTAANDASASQSKKKAIGRSVTVDELYTDMTDTLRRKQRARTNADESSPILTAP